MARVFVIEDNPQALELMTYLMATHGRSLATAETDARGCKMTRLEPRAPLDEIASRLDTDA